MRFGLLVLLCLYAGLADAEWSGVKVTLADDESDWKFDSDEREAQSTRISFKIEEATETDLSVGIGIGYMNVRLVGTGAIETRKFYAEYFEVFLHQPFKISESFALHTSLSYRYNIGHDDDDVDEADITWKETALEIGASVRFSNFRLTPFATYYDVDGDVDADSGTDVFEIDDPVSGGIRFDYYVEKSAFVRLELKTGDYAGGYLTFARDY